MNTDKGSKKKWSVGRIIALSVFVVLVAAGSYLYTNFNHLLSDALMKSFNSSVISDVYELKFENLRVNLFEGSIRVFNVTIHPREKPLNEYPYINSSFSLNTENLLLEKVEIRTLLRDNRLILEKIQITKPEIEFLLNGARHVMLPFNDAKQKDSVKTKRPIESFRLKEFKLVDAAFHSNNSNKQREFYIKDLNISVQDLILSQKPGEYATAFSEVSLSIDSFNGDLKKDPIQHLSFADFKIGIDSLNMLLTLDTLTYRYNDFQTKVKDLDVQTADSIYHIAMKSFDLSYNKKSIEIEHVSFKPNVSHAVIQKDFRYQHTEFSGSIDKLHVKNLNFDSLVYVQKIFVDEIELKNVKAAIFKDKTKPADSTRTPEYLGQTIRKIKLPLEIKKLVASDVELENTERKPDKTEAKIKINKAKLKVHNITNLNMNDKLEIHAEARLNGLVPFNAKLAFSYDKPQFTFEGHMDRFKLPDLNPLIQAYTPAKIHDGIADEIKFKGVAEEKSASGSMRFLYHNLNVDLELKEQAKWKSSVIAFAANTALNSSNPAYQGLQPREVTFKIDRDMHKGFVNVIIKSVLNGLKETMIMNKENRKAYKESKKKAKGQK